MATAKRIVAAKYGQPEDVLELRDVEVPPPGPGEVTIQVRAAGVNPVDAAIVSGAWGADPSALPVPVGSEVAGVITAIGPETRIATGVVAIGDPVIAYRVAGGYAEALTVPSSDVFAMPGTLEFEEAAGLMLVGVTAADMLRAVPVSSGDTVVVHGASGAVGASLLQQLAAIGARVFGTARADRLDAVRRFGAQAIEYGPGLLDRLHEAAPGFNAAYDTSGTDEAIDASLELLVDPGRLVSIAGRGLARARHDRFQAVTGSDPASAAYRNQIRGHLIELAAHGDLTVPVDRTFPLAQAGAALAHQISGDALGKVILLP